MRGDGAMSHFSLRQIAVFDAVARLGSVSRAAEEVALSQSAASMALKELEENLGTKLFHRHGRRLVLNENGKRLRPKAHSLLLLAAEIGRPQSEVPEVTLRIAASTTVGSYYLPECAAAFLARFPAVRIQLVIDGVTETVSQVEAMSADIGLVDTICNRSTVQIEPIGIDHAVVFAAPDHPLARRVEVSIGDLRKADWCLRQPPSMTRTHLSEILGGGGLNDVRFTANSYEAVKTAVKAGLGLGFASEKVIARELANGELSAINVPAVTMERRFTLLWPKSVYQSALPAAFAEHLRAWFSEAGEPALDRIDAACAT
jgi:DNA-binding transcriptional LysR family regulator